MHRSTADRPAQRRDPTRDLNALPPDTTVSLHGAHGKVLGGPR